MNKNRIGVIAIGMAMVVLSFAVPLLMVAMTPEQGTGIIGGAAGPTYWLLYRTRHLYFATAIGTVVTAVGVFRK